MPENSNSSVIKSTVRFFFAGILCFLSAYLSELTFGAVATIPFILLLPGVAYLIYQNKLYIVVMCTLASFLFKSVFSQQSSTVFFFTALCAVFSVVSVLMSETLIDYFIKKKWKKIRIYIASFLFIISLIIYFMIYGTFFANITSKSLNVDYLEKTYPEEDFLIGNTYYSFKDSHYVTEFTFTAKESYKAMVSAEKGGKAVIDGYRDYSRYEILNVGLEKIRTALSTLAYEGSDFVIRTDSLETDDKLTPESAYSNYEDKTCYEIALYYQFDTVENFEKMCKTYMEHIGSFENIKYKKITFYGFDRSDKDDFSYTSIYLSGSDKPKISDFDSSNYSRYFTEKDTHKYWELLG